MSFFLYKWYGRWLASKVEAALHHPKYGAEDQYLCQVLKLEIGGLGAQLAAAHINDLVSPWNTLHVHLMRLAPMNFPPLWSEREVYHRRFYIELIKHLREGDFDWGREPTLKELGMEHLAPKEPNQNV